MSAPALPEGVGGFHLAMRICGKTPKGTVHQMKRNMSLIALVVVVAMMGMTSLPAFAAASTVPLLPQLPHAQPMSDEELERIEGEGILTAIGAAAAAAVASYVSSVVDYAWERWVEGNEDAEWDVGEANKNAASTAAGAFVVGLLAPSA